MEKWKVIKLTGSFVTIDLNEADTVEEKKRSVAIVLGSKRQMTDIIEIFENEEDAFDKKWAMERAIAREKDAGWVSIYDEVWVDIRVVR